MIELRAAHDDDYEIFTHLFRELAVPDPTPSRQKWRDEMAPHAAVALEDGVVVGYCYFQIFTEVGYVRHLVVSPTARRGGVGRALMAEARRRFSEVGCTRWCLNVKPDNVPAIALYQSLGLETQRESATVRLAWRHVPRLPTTAATTVLDGARDEAVEHRFDLPKGQLSAARALPGRVLVTLLEADVVVGFASFDPAFPGAFPFRVATAAHARPLLEALRAHAAPDDDWVSVVVDDGPLVQQALLAAGGEVRLQILHLAGPLA
ncbi:MAG: GNAT family N-acetyltransferase [Myxococcales bacterium]|nr:GNAT family N-acetyltransferase [Myxococcales bacterium]